MQWPEVCPTKREDAQSDAKFLCWEAISQWGLPDHMFSDNRKELVDEMVKLILQKVDDLTMFRISYHFLQTKTFAKNSIVKICQHTGLNWAVALLIALIMCCLSITSNNI